MKMKNKIISVITAATQSKWIRPALLTVAILATVVVTGCDDTDHSGHQSNHRNQTHLTGGNF